ncbi:MAG: exodeoxyribonuclease V subunit gamma [Denitrovibrio sp.]|nr:MAG: exodeoxyribonuclease V subunit gamma [Denitrovibrio sp.]
MLKVYTGNKLETLLSKMDTNIKTGTKSPLAKIPVCIQSPGMQRWIGLKLAEQTGISANLDFIFPGALMKRLAGVKAHEQTPWPEKHELTWKILDNLKTLPQTDLYLNINNYLNDDPDNIKAYRLAMRIADTFDQYQIYRPDMILDWLTPKPKDIPKEPSDQWQLELFQSVFPTRDTCKTFVFDRFIKNCIRDRNISHLNAPMHIFGISVMPAFFIEMLKAASNHTDVYFYLLSPTKEYWGDSKTIREKRRLEKISAKTAEEIYIEEKHELLDNLGVIGRDFFDYIFGSDESFIDEDDYEDIERKSVLSTMQAEILELKYGEEKPKYDGSIIINNCHNPLRELETLYDQLLEMFNKDIDLKPSEILIMTPDIEKYSPYIKAVFDNPYSERERIPYSVADVSEKQSSRPAGIFLELIETIRGNFSIADVFKILSYDIIANNYGINKTNIKTIASVLHKTGAFWGYDSDHLNRENLDIDDTFTWQKGLRRVALGLAEGDTGTFYNDMAAIDIPFSLSEEIGSLMKFVDQASIFASELNTEKTISEWCDLLQLMTETFMGNSYEYADDTLYLNKCIADINNEADAYKNPINAEPIIERITETLSETRGAKGFISGRVTFCAMLPMRSIPFKVISIIGLDENTFPRQKVSLEFDLIAKNPIAGDRNNRDSDRYLFLETMISAREKLILSYVGQSERDNAELPPSTLITELTAHLNNRFDINDIITKHKLHSFSKEYFKGGELFTYSPARYEAAKAFSSVKGVHNFSDKPIEAKEKTKVSLAEFESFFISPPAIFLKSVLGINTSIYDDTLPETEPLSLDTLTKYQIEDDAIKEHLSGDDPNRTLDYLYKTSQLPPENLGQFHIEETVHKSTEIANKASDFLGGIPTTVKIESEIAGLQIIGDIEGVSGDKHTYIKPAEIKAKDLMRAWIRHLLLNNIQPTSTELIGKTKSMSLQPADPKILSELVSIFKDGQRGPLRFHATDAIHLNKPKSLSTDIYNRLENDYSFNICFGEDAKLDYDLADKITRPIFENLEGGK